MYHLEIIVVDKNNICSAHCRIYDLSNNIRQIMNLDIGVFYFGKNKLINRVGKCELRLYKFELTIKNLGLDDFTMNIGSCRTVRYNVYDEKITTKYSVLIDGNLPEVTLEVINRENKRLKDRIICNY